MKVTLFGNIYDAWDLYVIFESITQGGLLFVSYKYGWVGPFVMQLSILGMQIVASWLIKRELKAKRW